MSDSACGKKVEGRDSRETKSKTSRLPCSAAEPTAQQETSAPGRQLLCSLNRAEVQAIREELSRAGIETETRNNATAEALGVTGFELWVKLERDFADAASLYAKIQARSRGGSSSVSSAIAPAEKSRSAVEAPVLEKSGDSSAGAHERRCGTASQVPADPLEKDIAALEKRIEEMLEFQRDVVAQCVAVRGSTTQLRQAFTEKQASAFLENEKRAVAQRRQAEMVTSLEADLDRERLDRQQLTTQLEEARTKCQECEELLASEKENRHEQGKSQEESLVKAQDKLDLQARLLQTHAAAVLKLRKELAALEGQRLEDRQLVSKLREELAAERKTRLAAEREAEAALAEKSRSLPSLLFRRLTPKKAQSN